MKEKDVELPFSNYLKFHKPSKKTDKTELKVITKSKWKKSDNTIVNSGHPPLEPIILDYKGSSIIASPFKLPSDRSDCKQIIEQVNYTNQCLKVIGEQLDKIETKIDEGETNCTPSSSKIIEKPLILLPERRSQIKLNPDKNIQKIEDMLQKLIVKSEPVKTQVAVLTQADDDSSQPSSTDDEISNLQAQFTSQPGNPGNIKRLIYPTTNPTSLTKNWYSRPTPPDLQFEENNLASQFSVSASKLYEWNIDGLSEHQILEKLNLIYIYCVCTCIYI
ncbi:hypothetical protein RHMOL_Rhmol02G0190000 [Rhododendron molle]|uniref:Uncharacterized protein n=1 Tax=Rhododendron molle TaxID=49168 RepID=A0ACC0PT76_RHOML|nr:hypothetical protein RHMOL_Rhmol02G0190000 [Rhododendron molle]